MHFLLRFLLLIYFEIWFLMIIIDEKSFNQQIIDHIGLWTFRLINHQNHFSKMIQFIQNMEKIDPFILTKYFDFWSWFLIDEKSFNKSFNASADHFQFTLHHVGLWTFGCHSDRSLEITIEFGCHSLKNFWPIESLLHNTVVAVCSTHWDQIFC